MASLRDEFQSLSEKFSQSDQASESIQFIQQETIDKYVFGKFNLYANTDYKSEDDDEQELSESARNKSS